MLDARYANGFLVYLPYETLPSMIILLNLAKLKIKNISPVVYLDCVLKVGDSGHFSVRLKADILTSATDRRLRSSMKIG